MLKKVKEISVKAEETSVEDLEILKNSHKHPVKNMIVF